MQPTPPSPHVTARPPGTGPGASIGIFLALLAALGVFSFSSTALLRFPDRAIGAGLMGGVDPARRVSLYVVLVAVVLGVWLACHYGVRLLWSKRPSWFSGIHARLEADLCALFAAVGSVALVARVSAGSLARLGSAQMCLGGIAGVLAFGVVRRRLGGRRLPLGSLNMLAFILLLAWPASPILGVLTNPEGPHRARLVLAGTLFLPLVFASALAFCLRRPGRATRSDICRAFALGAAPLFFFPSLCPVANEVQYTLAQRHAVSPRSVALVFLALLAGVSALLFWRARAGKLRLSPARVLAWFVFPAIIFGETLLSVYTHKLRITHVDPLHDGEQITAVHQLLSFDKWPFVDIWPAHGLFDYVGALYSLVNGFRPLEITAWNDTLSALSACAVYAMLANICPPLLAFLVAALLPIEAILPLPIYSYFYAEPGLLAVGLLTCVVLARPSTGRYTLLSFVTFLCFFWTPTSGVASIVAVLALLILSWITASDRRPVARGIAVFAGVGVLVFASYALIVLLRGQPVLETFRLIRAFMQADPLIGGYATVIAQFDTMAFVQYLLLPGIGLFYLAKLARHALDRRPLHHVDRVLGFLTLVSFVLFARTLTRHGIVERYQPFYFPLLALCALSLRQPGAALAPLFGGTLPEQQRGSLAAHFWQRASARAWFCVGLGLYLVCFPQASYKSLVFDAFQFHAWKAGESRLKGDVPTYPKLSRFLAATLGPKDTFLELLNMPVLYGLLDREVPGEFFLPTMFYATDSVQNSYLSRLEAFGGRERVPVVLLATDDGRNIDNIDNTLRSYRIVEHVYRNYQPYGKMDGVEVWLSRSRWEAAAAAVPPLPLDFRDPGDYRTHSVRPPLLEAGVLRIATKGADPWVENVVELNGLPLGLASHHAVRLSYRTSVAGELELYYRIGERKYNAAASGRATLATSPAGEWQTVEVAIPMQADPRARLVALRIDPPDDAELEVKDVTLVFGKPPATDAESQAAGMLPFFWGNFDERRAAETARVLETIEVPAEKAPLAAFNLKFDPIVDKASGNYLALCIRLPEFSAPSKSPKRWLSVQHEGSWQSAGKVTLSYGASPSARFAFDLVQPRERALGVPEELALSFADACKPYLVRLSAQYIWSSQAISSIQVASSVPIVLESARLLAGD